MSGFSGEEGFDIFQGRTKDEEKLEEEQEGGGTGGGGAGAGAGAGGRRRRRRRRRGKKEAKNTGQPFETNRKNGENPSLPFSGDEQRCTCYGEGKTGKTGDSRKGQEGQRTGDS